MKRIARPNVVILQSLLIGALLVGITVGGTLATQNLPSSWKSSLNPPPIQTLYFNGTALALELGKILSFMNANQFSNASLALSSLSFGNYPGTLPDVVGQAESQLQTLVVSLPLAGSSLSNAVDLLSSGLFSKAPAALNEGCAQSILANTTLVEFENVTTPQLAAQGVPTYLYLANLVQLQGKVHALSRQCQVLSRELEASFRSNGMESCIDLNGDSFCLSLSSPQKSVEVGGSLIVQGILLENNVSVPGDMISFYLNGTYLTETTTMVDGIYNSSLSVPYIYSNNASIWAVASENSSLGLSVALGSNPIFVQLLFNGTKIVLDAGSSHESSAAFFVPFQINKSECWTQSNYPPSDSKQFSTFWKESDGCVAI